MDDGDRALALDEKTGNALTAFLPAAQVSGVPGDAPMPASLVAVWHGPRPPLVFDRFRHQWELPGGGIERGKTPLHRPPPGGTQIIDATVALHTRPEQTR
ncbi:hypothetical protein OG417_03085 [Actinoallomurus sp. NBC_01490]|uniref:hypothetical protein n=1 Tax=Actinoallomurus sp. NBC_01490 TaxID=2903557 RepID=UPI002E33FD63|nr:hypothetical protein [Actinoallomurus sp. NBC_01490]